VSTFRFEIDGDAFKVFQRELRKVEPEMAKELKKELRAVVETHVVPAAKANAGWSSRIPGAIKPQVLAKGMGVRVAAKQAPHGRPFEGLRGNSSFRHPVFGNRNVWVSQRTLPFLWPAVDANQEKAAQAALKAVDAAGRAAGFR
jgi:hypothetical protein